MKKTIAILLVLVLAGAGLFAAEAVLNIGASVSAQSLIKITDEATGPYDFADFIFEAFNTMDDTVTSTVIINESNFAETEPVIVGHLNYWSNQTTGLATTVTATVLRDRTESTTNTSKIGYTVFLSETSIVTVTNAQELATAASPTILIASNSVTSSYGAQKIKVKVNENDYRLALASDAYTATIKFNYIAN
ncbi:MAG: hypothetical protein JEY71_11125 [Sphaerochaeta sp.]|nr:hypothetical protein [Sphaerochaeta sp.]